MKLLIFIALSSLKLISQTTEEYAIENLHTYMKSKPKWSAISRGSKTAFENKLITSIIVDSTHTFCDEWDTGEEYFKNFHFIDLDGDNDLDLIFEGLECGGFESETVLIYMNIKNQYKEVLKVMGRISSIKLNAEFTIYEYPCCAMIENTFITYKIHKDALMESFGFTFFYNPILGQTSKDYDQILPQVLKSDKEYLLKENTVINYFPNESMDQPTYIKKSQMGILQAQTSVFSYASYLDKLNVKWVYCKIPKEIVSVTNKNIKYSFLAWVKLTK